jgi:hypothetical protein
LRHVDDRSYRLLHQLAVVLAEPVEGRSTLHEHSGRRDLGKAERVVLARPHRLREIEAHLRGIHVEGGDEGDVSDCIAAEACVHEAGNYLGLLGVRIKRDPLDEGIGAVSDTGDSNFQGHASRAP